MHVSHAPEHPAEPLGWVLFVLLALLILTAVLG